MPNAASGAAGRRTGFCSERPDVSMSVAERLLGGSATHASALDRSRDVGVGVDVASSVRDKRDVCVNDAAIADQDLRI